MKCQRSVPSRLGGRGRPASEGRLSGTVWSGFTAASPAWTCVLGGGGEDQGGRSRSLLQASLLRPSDRLQPGVAPRSPAPPRLDQSAFSVDEPGLSNPNSCRCLCCLLFFLPLPLPSPSSSSSSLFILSAAEKSPQIAAEAFTLSASRFPSQFSHQLSASDGGNASPALRTNSSTRRFRRSANRRLTNGDTVVCLAFRRR